MTLAAMFGQTCQTATSPDAARLSINVSARYALVPPETSHLACFGYPHPVILDFTHGGDCSRAMREPFAERAISTAVPYKTNFAGIVRPRLEEFYAPVRSDCWPRGLRKGPLPSPPLPSSPGKRHTTEEIIFRDLAGHAHRESSAALLSPCARARARSASRRCPGDFMYTGGCVALLKPFPDNTSAPLRSHAGGTPAALPLTAYIMHVYSHGHPVYIIRQAGSISFSRSVYDPMCASVGVLQ